MRRLAQVGTSLVLAWQRDKVSLVEFTCVPAAKKSPLVLVVAACLIDQQGRVLLSQRPEGKKDAGDWEFPGGKVCYKHKVVFFSSVLTVLAGSVQVVDATRSILARRQSTPW